MNFRLHSFGINNCLTRELFLQYLNEMNVYEMDSCQVSGLAWEVIGYIGAGRGVIKMPRSKGLKVRIEQIDTEDCGSKRHVSKI
jgi:hypothetical protein